LELEGLKQINYVKELIEKSFDTKDLIINKNIYEFIFKKFNGHIRYSIEVFARSLSAMHELKRKEVDINLIEMVSTQIIEEIKSWEAKKNNTQQILKK